jgi:His-Xaa-Ser system radical SAM maturase HxsB
MLTTIGTPKHSHAAFFRHRELAGRHLLTNLEGDWLLLSPDELGRFVRADLDSTSELYARLRAHNFLRDGYDAGRAALRLGKRKAFLRYGPNLHIIVVTLRCNETCVYCHASRAPMDAFHTDMTPETAERVVDLILQTTSPSVTIEFQGGEPLANFPVVRHIIEHALERNRAAGKQLEFTLVSNLSLLDEEKLAYLLGRKVQICTSLDGPEALHDRQRKLPGASAYRAASRWIERINRAYGEMGLDTTLYHVEALLTTTREALSLPREIVDAYVGLGCKALFLRPVDPFGFAERTGPLVAYPRREYLRFYREAVDYMIELNRRGIQVLERYAAIFLTKILAGEDPNFLDIRSPCGASIGQLAYNYDGKVFTCDEGRMLHEMGDSSFLVGEAGQSSYREILGHETTRALLVASNLDQQPDCVNCAYNPYCGVCPVHNHRTQGSFFGRMRDSSWCAVHKGIQDYLFARIGDGDPEVLEIFRRWTTVRERSHFLQLCPAA